MKQIDVDEVPTARADRVAFVCADDTFRQRGAHTWTEHRYFASLHARPITSISAWPPLETCPHRHVDMAKAEACARRMLRSRR